MGQAFCYWILPKSGVPIARTTVRPITDAELSTHNIQQELCSYDALIRCKLGDHLLTEESLSFSNDFDELRNSLADVADDDDGIYHPVEPEANRPDLDEFDEETIDKLLSAEVVLSKGDLQCVRKIINRKRDLDGNPIGRANTNPILDTQVYEVEFLDGTIAEYAANVLAEALYMQVNTDGNRFLLLKEIIGHMKDKTAASANDEPIHNTNGTQNPSKHITTKVWKFQCLWADGSSSWEPLQN